MAEKKTAEKIEDNLQAMLRSIDDKMERLTDGFDKQVAKGLKAILPLEVTPDESCEVHSGALPVSVALRAVDYGLARVALRAVPKLSEEFLEKGIKKLIKQAGSLVGFWGAAKLLGKKIPVVGDLTQILIGYSDEKTFSDRFQKAIRAVLGCRPSAFDPSPMKFALNLRMAKTVKRDNQDRRLKAKVRTRHAETRSKSKRKLKL